MHATDRSTTANLVSIARLHDVRAHVLAAIWASRIPVIQRQLDEQRKRAN